MMEVGGQKEKFVIIQTEAYTVAVAHRKPQVPWEENWLELGSVETGVCMCAHVLYLKVQDSDLHVGGMLRGRFYYLFFFLTSMQPRTNCCCHNTHWDTLASRVLFKTY